MKFSFRSVFNQTSNLYGFLQLRWVKLPRAKMIFILIFVFCLVGYLLFNRQRRALQEIQYQQLSAISELMSSQIELWLNERRQNIRLASIDNELTLQIHLLIQTPANIETRKKITEHLNSFGQNEYNDINVYDASGNEILSTRHFKTESSAFIKKMVARAIDEDQTIISPLYLSDIEKKVSLDFFRPLYLKNKAGKKIPIGAISLRIDPTTSLFPRIQSWPVPSATGENLIVAKEGDSVVYLHEVRHMQKTALELKIPLTRTNIAAVQAVLGQTGLVAGADYRGIPVISVLKPIKDSPWFLITKIDVSEANAPIRRYLIFYLLILVSLSVIVVYVSKALWGEQHIAALKKTEADLREARSAAEAASVAKSQFLSNMSHEIRTPLNAMIGFSDLLMGSNLDDNQRKYLDKVRHSGEALLEIVNNILDIAKIESGQFTIEKKPFSLNSLATRLANIFEPVAKRKGIKFQLKKASDVPDQILGDQVRIQQVLTNLLSNAFKFTEQGEIILLIEKDTEHKPGTWFKFSVSDTGKGIPKDKLPLLFQRFSQVDSSITREYGGTGLGLSICKELARLMFGEIKVISQEGKGSVFTLSLPLELSQEKNLESDKTSNSVNLFRPLKILLVEDSEDNSFLVSHYLKSLPIQIDFAKNGKEAVDIYKISVYDLVLMDMQMPVMDGFEATKLIREWEKTNSKPAVPIIALTAYAFAEDIEKTKSVGCNAHLSKPVKKNDLIEVIVKETKSSTRRE